MPGVVQRLHLDNHVVKADAVAHLTLGGVVDKLDRHEVITWQLQHGQFAVRRMLDGSDRRKAEGGVERE
jgi:hypothetical protein